MIGVVLAGGKGTRLYPITRYVNKHILPIGDKPMIYYPINTLIESGIKKIIVVTGRPFDKQVKEVVRELNFTGIKIHFTVQDKPLGMPDAIRTVASLVGKQSIIVVGGDNIFGKSYKKYVSSFKAGELSFLRKIPNPKSAGVPIYNKRGELIDIVEKPKEYSGGTAICGPHIFDNKVFDIIKTLKLSKRGEYELVDIHKSYLKQGLLKLEKTNDYWSDTGTLESLARASYKMLKTN